MELHPEDVRYWQGWTMAGVVVIPLVLGVATVLARVFLVNPILRALRRTGTGLP